MEKNKISNNCLLNNIFPLSKGDCVAIVAPSDLVLSEDQLNIGIDFLKQLGLKVIYSPEIFDLNKTSYKNKAKEINRYFSDKTIKAIICAQGGDSAEHILTYLDYESITSNPKIFMGMSDITVILNALYQKSNLITFHGPDIIFGLGKFLSEYTQNSFVDRLMNGGNKLDYDHNMCIIQPGKCEGIIIGGNLRCLAKLADTDFFINNNSPKILFFESLSLTIEEVKDKLDILREKSIFNNTKGIILGNFKSLIHTGQEEVLFQLFKEEFPTQPIIFINQFGHINKNTILPIGANCIINTLNKDLMISYH